MLIHKAYGELPTTVEAAGVPGVFLGRVMSVIPAPGTIVTFVRGVGYFTDPDCRIEGRRWVRYRHPDGSLRWQVF